MPGHEATMRDLAKQDIAIAQLLVKREAGELRWRDHYWTADEMIDETKSLARQLVGIQQGQVRFHRGFNGKYESRDRRRRWKRVEKAFDKAQRLRKTLEI